MSSRLINEAEIALARQVFQDQLPYNKIHLASYYLPNNDGVPVTLASVSSLIPIRSLRSYTIYFGPQVFKDGADAPGTRNTFIHELTHVWQGHHSHFAWEYMVKSMLSQGHAMLTTGDRNNAYTYKPGNPWADYNVEQQASIVADWFTDGMRTEDKDDRFTYIVNNIRAGSN
jgi:hypothetical protein